MARSAKNANSSLVPHARDSLLKQRVFYAPLSKLRNGNFSRRQPHHSFQRGTRRRLVFPRIQGMEGPPVPLHLWRYTKYSHTFISLVMRRLRTMSERACRRASSGAHSVFWVLFVTTKSTNSLRTKVEETRFKQKKL